MSVGPIGSLDWEDLGRASIAGTRAYALTARASGRTYLIEVARPAAPPPPGRAPVVYVLDGNGAFGLATQTARMLQMQAGGLPPLLVVGVGYRFDPAGDAGVQHGAGRSLDFSPSVDTHSLERTRAAFAALGDTTPVEHGGADAFLAFIEQDLKPFIASRYAVDPADQTLAGMSLGGLFALHALVTAPTAFRRMIAVSPPLWWDDGVIFREEAALAERVDDLAVDLFLGVGGLEEEDGAPYWPVSNLARMDAALRSRRYPGLRLTHHVFAEETHMSVLPGALSRGLRAVFGTG